MNFEKKIGEYCKSLVVNIHSHFLKIESLLNPQQPSDPTNTSKLYRVVLDLSKENNIFAPAVAIGTNSVIQSLSHSVYLSISQYFSLFLHVSTDLLLFISVCLFVCLFSCQPKLLSVYLFH